ncbi:helicase [Bifidobacterium adolescentis]|nr:helicase [Bifidobacterium adolescentis]
MKSPKFEEGLKLIRDLVNQGKKVIVWGLFVNTLQKISSRLDDSDIDNRLIYGETPVDVRKDFIADFRNPNGPAVLVSNPQTLGESVSLQDVVHDAVYFEFNFNLTYMLQSRDRIHRLGLPDGQYTRYHIMETINDPTEYGFIDSRVYKRLKYKERRMREAIDGDVLKPEVTDDLLADVRSIIENERRSIAKAHAKTVNVEIE